MMNSPETNQNPSYTKIAAIYKKWGISLMRPSGEMVYRAGKRAFCQEFSLDRAAIGRVSSGKSRSHKGWRRNENV